jgi:UDP-N-acetylmuramate dehydrogenase
VSVVWCAGCTGRTCVHGVCGGPDRSGDNWLMLVQNNVPLQAHNSFHIVAKANLLARINSEAEVRSLLADPVLSVLPKFVLGGGSNIVLTGDVKPLVLKVEIAGRRLVQTTDRHFIVEVGGGENWHEVVAWTLSQGWPGLENMALIPGTVGAAPVQNIGAYGVELQDRFDSLDAIDLQTGQVFTLNAAQCAFGYRDSVFKHDSAFDASLGQQGFGLRNRALILRVRLAIPKVWQPELGYADLQRRMAQENCPQPKAQQIFDWVCDIRRSKLPDPDRMGNAGSFFKNPTVSPEQCADIIAREPKVVHYPLPNGSIKLAAAWLIDACGWRGKSVGQAGVYEQQALVLVNRGSVDGPDGATGGEVMTLARAIQTSVYERFGIRLEAEPVVV